MWWMREVADVRIHGTTGERPIDRFQKEEAAALHPLDGRPPFCQIQEVRRIVHNDCCVDIGTNRYSVPWKYIKEEVTVQVVAEEVIISQGPIEIARHHLCLGQREQ
ncbi:hypothetical protein LCGC14_2952360, partial [marine sediment metagenome]